jgi:hypothetical protein
LEGAQSEQVVQAGSLQQLALVLKRNSRPQQVDHIPKISLHKSNIEAVVWVATDYSKRSSGTTANGSTGP